jgi:hypothetical protein
MAKNVNCYVCGKKNLTRNEIGLNAKLIGRDVKKYHCLQCMAEYLELSVEELEERIHEFKDAGCVLFD